MTPILDGATGDGSGASYSFTNVQAALPSLAAEHAGSLVPPELWSNAPLFGTALTPTAALLQLGVIGAAAVGGAIRCSRAQASAKIKLSARSIAKVPESAAWLTAGEHPLSMAISN